MKEPQTVSNSTIYPEEFAQFSDLWYPLPMALVMVMLRLAVEKGVFKHVGIRLGLKDHKRPYPVQNAVLEKAFKRKRSLVSEDLKLVSQDSGLSNLQVTLHPDQILLFIGQQIVLIELLPIVFH